MRPGSATAQRRKCIDRRHRLLIAISNAVDKGRWFFPNIDAGGHGSNKPKGFQGYRHEVLDGLVQAYRSLGQLDYTKQASNVRVRDDLVSAKRAFVGEVQQILDPAGQQDEFGRLALRRRPTRT